MRTTDMGRDAGVAAYRRYRSGSQPPRLLQRKPTNTLIEERLSHEQIHWYTANRVAIRDSLLLTGDISAGAESALVRSGVDLKTTVLKVAHHGSLTSTSPDFVARTSPLVDVISVGANNRYGHPSDEVIARLTGDVVLRTARHGDVT